MFHLSPFEPGSAWLASQLGAKRFTKVEPASRDGVPFARLLAQKFKDLGIQKIDISRNSLDKLSLYFVEL